MKSLGITALVWTILSASAAALPAQGDYNKGLSYYKQGQFAKAITEFEPIVAANPDYEDGYRILGYCYLKTRQFAKAAQSFQKSLDLKDGNIASYLGLATALFNSGRYRDAVAKLLQGERHAESVRDKLQVYQIKGASYFNLGDWAKAVENLNKAQSIRRGEVDTLLQLGISHFKLGHYSEASGYLDQVLAVDGGNQQALRFKSEVDNRRAAQAISDKDPATAIQLLTKTVSANPQDGESWFNLGLAQLLAKDLGEAEKALLKAAQFLPDRASIHDRLGYIYEVTKRYPKALDAYQKANELTPSAETQASIERVQERIRRQKAQ